MRRPTRIIRPLKLTLRIICTLLAFAAICVVIRHFILRKENLLGLVRTFTSKCLHRDINVFVIDPVVLRSLVAVNESKPHCVLCSAVNVISLGVMEADWDKRGSVLQDLSDHGIVLQEMVSPDPRLLSLTRLNVSSIPTHYFFHWGWFFRSFIHLVVFYERTDNFLWHSALEPSKTTGLNLPFGRNAGAYNRLSLQGMAVDGIWLHFPSTVEQFLAQMSQSEFIECDYKRAQEFQELHPKISDSFAIAIKAFGIKIDVNFLYEEKTYRWHGGTEPTTGRKFKYIFPKSNLCWTSFMGLRVRVPCPALPYIINGYGPEWNTSITSWDWRKSGRNVKTNGRWSKEDLESFNN